MYVYYDPKGTDTHLTCECCVQVLRNKMLSVYVVYTIVFKRRVVLWLITYMICMHMSVIERPQQVILWVWGLLYVTMTELSSPCFGTFWCFGLASHTMVAWLCVPLPPSLFTCVWLAHVSASLLIIFLSVCQEQHVCIGYICLMSAMYIWSMELLACWLCLLIVLGLMFFTRYIYIYMYVCIYMSTKLDYYISTLERKCCDRK